MTRKCTIAQVTQVKIIFALFGFILLYFVFQGVTTAAWEGDSIYIHLPIAWSILDGSFITLTDWDTTYYPGANEAILAFLLLFKLPVGLFNVLGVIALFLSARFLGIAFKLKPDFATLFAVGVAALPGVLRWMTTQKIDIWMLAWFALSLALLQKPEHTIRYFLRLGVVMGMLIGSKFTGIFFATVLLLFYAGKLISKLSISNLSVLALPILVFGGFWYIRNFVATGNPFYPQQLLFFKGDASFAAFDWTVWKVLFYQPSDFLSAFISEYMLFLLSFLVVPLFLFKQRRRPDAAILKLFAVGLLSFGVYLFLPSERSFDSVVFGIRYSFPFFLCFALAFFILLQKLQRTDIGYILVFINLLSVFPTLSYHPKLIAAYLLIVVAFLSIKRLRSIIRIQ